MRCAVTGAVAAVAVAVAGGAEAKVRASGGDLYVRAGAPQGGDGSLARPFRSLRRLARASSPGQRLVVLRPRGRAAALDGGIALKRGQRLLGAGPSVRRRSGHRAPAITNTTRRHSGDAVVLADRSRVRNLSVAGARRGAIYGLGVSRAVVTGNDLSGHNASCAEGFHIPPFAVPTTAPGVGIPISEGLRNGWAAIMVDARRGRSRITIRRNLVHDAECGDGIDLRAMGRARMRARVERNVVRDLRQGPEFESLLAFGLQSADRARLRARLDRNRQLGLGNAEDPGVGPAGADSEGVFVNPTGRSRLRAAVTRNRYRNPGNLGGFSANGLEFVSMGDGARARLVVRRSSFSGTPGDVLEQFGLGTNARLRMRLVDVVAERSTGAAGTGFGNSVVIPANNGDCLVAASGGAGNVIRTELRRTRLLGCANNGLTFGSAVANGSGPTAAMELRVADSEITGNRGANLRVGNLSELDRLTVAIERTDLGDAGGAAASGLGNASFEELGATAHASLDLGGGPLGSGGGNCLDGGLLAAEVLGYAVSAAGNWWGDPGGPPPGRTLVAGGELDARDPLPTAPAICGRR